MGDDLTFNRFHHQVDFCIHVLSYQAANAHNSG